MHRPTIVRATLVLLVCVAAAVPARAGHESPFYPSYYPQEIRVDTVDPAAAGPLLRKGAVHAYVGADPFGAAPAGAGTAGGGGPGAPPADDVRAVESLGGWVTVTFNDALPAWRAREARCGAAPRVVRALAGARPGGFVLHPYPVTPYHGDFLEHADLAAAAARAGEAAEAAGAPLKLKARGAAADALLPAAWRATGAGWDAVVEVAALPDLLAPHRIALSGWLGPPWLKAGWFHAYLLYGPALADPAARARAGEVVRRLETDPPAGVERVNLERTLVVLLTSGCERVVAGYQVRREWYSSEYSEGIENVASDSHAGLGSGVFVRTAKLKDFPWNGWMRLGVAARPEAAWNPVAGFTDPAGRLLWAALGDPALLPDPYGDGWVANRVLAEPAPPAAASAAAAPASGAASPVAVPADALLPDAATGALREVGPAKTAAVALRYRALASLFHDGTRTTVSDLLYAYVLAERVSGAGAPAADPAVRRSTALVREWLVGVKPVSVEKQVRDLGEIKLAYEVPVVDVYLRHRAGDLEAAATVAPPWTNVPWHVVALMEATVERGLAAFSAEEAARRGVPWLDLARDQRVKSEMAGLVERFAREGFVPPPLARLVTAEEARERWSALKRFFRQHGHFLVTNGPYLLDKWTAEGAVLTVFRDLTFPLGVGTFDRYAVPRRAFVAKAEARGARLEVLADAERVFRFGRSFELKREPFGAEEGDERRKDVLVCRYLVVAPDGRVVRAGEAPPPAGNRFTVELGRPPGPGPHRVLVALYLNSNGVSPDVRVIPWTL